MRSVFGLVLVIGLGLAGFAVFMVKGYIDEQEQVRAAERAAIAARAPTIEVVAVKEMVPYGATLTPDDVGMILYAEPFLPEGVFRTIKELFPNGAEEPRVVLRQMEPLEPVLAVKVTEPGGDAGITSLLQPGMRAFAIRVDVASGVSGLLRPNDRVDVYWTGRAMNVGDMGTTDVTQLIQSSLKIIAIDQIINGSVNTGTVARTVTVEATPQQVAALAQAQSTGSLMLSLVGAFDETIAAPVVVDQNTLLGIEAAPAPEPEPEVVEEKVCTVRTRRGGDVVEIPIPCTD
ncbi:Flp pilus assembly protein CpaB [Marivivens sp.]|jgi:pilus assembly protein CpaB|uniref:Flp pilus assembly protein CpaB n=1 Tax=Marivivens sp. TaxID=1978374 RepID=UPI00201FA595|nr:Flp pilus assembly protein CpaB [Marivivens sp.]MCL7406607.1 Flp pilus assembly protein CpaB [Marivivens geojensis]